MNKQELIERIENLPCFEGPIACTVTVNREWILNSIEQLDEPQKATVPQFVADLIKYAKEHDWDLEDTSKKLLIVTGVRMYTDGIIAVATTWTPSPVHGSMATRSKKKSCIQ